MATLTVSRLTKRFGSVQVLRGIDLEAKTGEFVALVVAEKALQQYRGTSFEKPLLSAIKKMEQALPDTISLNLADIEQTISFRMRAEQILDL